MSNGRFPEARQTYHPEGMLIATDADAEYHAAIGEAIRLAAAPAGTLKAERLSEAVQAVEEYEIHRRAVPSAGLAAITCRNGGPSRTLQNARPCTPARCVMAIVLIVEDQSFLAYELELALVEAGHTVLGKAASFDEAVRMAGSQAPQIALIDHRLKGPKDGVAVAKHCGVSGRR